MKCQSEAAPDSGSSIVGRVEEVGEEANSKFNIGDREASHGWGGQMRMALLPVAREISVIMRVSPATRSTALC